MLAPWAALPFAHVILAGHVLYDRDIQALRWGRLEAFARTVAAGSWPLWNPFEGVGQAMLADPGSQVLYPFTWLSLVLAPADAYDLYAVAHVLFAGLGAFVLARRLGASFHAGLLSGALFLLSGPVLATTSLWQHLAGVAWVPWVLAAGDAALERPGLRRTIVWGGAVALQMLAGSLDYVLLGGAAQAVLALRQVGAPPEGWRGAGRRLAAAAGAVAVAAGLSAAQWMPALELLVSARRAEIGEFARVPWSLHPALALQALAPAFPHDLPLSTAARQALYDGREPLLTSIYLGAAALPLVIAGVFRRPRRTSVLLAVLAAGATAVALGRYAPAYSWAVEALPAFRVLRYPTKALVLLALAWSLLAGLGADSWRHLPGRVRAGACAAALAVAAALGLAWAGGAAWSAGWLDPDPLGRPAAAVLAPVLAPLAPAAILAAATAAVLLARLRTGTALALAGVLAACDLALAHRGVAPSLPRGFFASTPGLIAAAKADGAWRLQMFDYVYRRTDRVGPGWKAEDPPAYRALPRAVRGALREREFPLDGARWGLRGGLTSDVAGLESNARYALVLLVRYYQEDGARLARLLRLGGVTHLATRHLGGLEAFALRAEVRTQELGDAFLLRVPEPRPRAYAVEGVRVASGRAAYSLLTDGSFDPGSSVVLSEGAERAAAPGFDSRVRVLEDRPDRILVEARLSRPGELVVLEGFDRGWRARVDGREARLRTANTVFLSVPLEAGEHRVELAYRPTSAAVGLLASLASALAVGLALARRRAPRPAGPAEVAA
jgi:hypothetical protein